MGEGEEEEEMVLLGRRLDMGRGQLLSHGRLSNPGGAPPPGWGS